MATAIIGTGNIGGTLARHLVGGGESVRHDHRRGT
jgi:predicted dinucleotide-binding enzyme